MRPRISIRDLVRPLVRPLVRRSILTVLDEEERGKRRKEGRGGRRGEEEGTTRRKERGLGRSNEEREKIKKSCKKRKNGLRTHR